MSNCCPEVRKEDWEYVQHEWNKYFLEGNVFQLFRMPLNYGSVLKKLAAAAKARNWDKHGNPLVLTQETGFFSMQMLLELFRPDPKADGVVFFSGSFISHYYEGPYSGLGKAVQELDDYVTKATGLPPKDYFFWYTTCPKCAKERGNPVTVIFARI